MSALRHIAKLFSATPSALRAILLGFGLAFAATDPSVAVVGKAVTALSPAAAHAETAQAVAAFNRSAERAPR